MVKRDLPEIVGELLAKYDLEHAEEIDQTIINQFLEMGPGNPSEMIPLFRRSVVRFMKLLYPKLRDQMTAKESKTFIAGFLLGIGTGIKYRRRFTNTKALLEELSV